MKKLGIKFVLIVLCVGLVVPLIPVKQTEAQWVVEFGPTATSLIGGIVTATGTTAIATSATALTTGVVGAGSVTVGTMRASLGATCQTTITTLEATDVASTIIDTSSSAALEAIGGGALEFGKISAKIAKATAAKVCVDSYVLVLSNAPGITLQQGSELAREQDKYTKISASLKQTIEDLSAQQSASVKEILKAFMIKVILNVSKSLTTEVVNKLVDKYKITDYLAYGDALATQVYSMKYINENYSGDARQQMMIRSILQSEKFPEKINTVKSMANDKANEYLGQACNVASGTTAQDDNYFLKCLAAYGSPQANPIFHTTQAYDQAQAANAAGKDSASSELSQSNGFAPPRNCEGSLGMQNQIDSQFDASAQTKDVAVLAAQKLKNALDMVPPRTTREEYQKAQAAADQAIANSLALGKQTSNPIIDICKGIDSPSSFVSDSIDKFLQKALVSDTDLKTDNLPFYASFLADVSSNFLTNILTGGKSSSQVLKEAGVGALNGALIGVLQTSAQGQGTTGTPANPTGEVEIYVRSPNSQARATTLVSGQPYVLTINFKNLVATSTNSKDPVFNPYRAVISGVSGDSDRNVTLTAQDLSSGNLIFDFTATRTFTVKIQFYAKGTEQTGPGDIPINTSGGWTKSFTVTGSVNGAVTLTPSSPTTVIMPRGPQVSFR